MTDDTMIFDVETVALPREQLEKMMPEFEPPGNVKDPAKVQAAIDAKRQEWIDKAALSATTASVALIGALQNGLFYMMRGCEPDVLREFWRIIHDAEGTVIGHNIKGFDLPFLIRRSFINHVPVPLGVLHKGRFTERFVDTMEVWAAGEWGAKISLNNLAKALGVGEKPGSGADFGKLWAEDKEAAIAYCKHDLELTRDCAERMGL